MQIFSVVFFTEVCSDICYFRRSRMRTYTYNYAL